MNVDITICPICLHGLHRPNLTFKFNLYLDIPWDSFCFYSFPVSVKISMDDLSRSPSKLKTKKVQKHGKLLVYFTFFVFIG